LESYMPQQFAAPVELKLEFLRLAAGAEDLFH
jgi:hypothetical protein